MATNAHEMNVSDEALRGATGRDWQGWLEALDAAGAADLDHKGIVALLEREHGDATTSWWRQSISVGYERARGLRAVGQTADAGFEIGVRKTLPVSVGDLWALITSRPDLWLGDDETVELEKGSTYKVPAGEATLAASGEIRVVKPLERLRMTWQPEGWTTPARLQVTILEATSGKATLAIHLEKLPDAATREAMRAHWRETLNRIASAITDS